VTYIWAFQPVYVWPYVGKTEWFDVAHFSKSKKIHYPISRGTG
jgi:hypothetical protein